MTLKQNMCSMLCSVYLQFSGMKRIHFGFTHMSKVIIIQMSNYKILCRGLPGRDQNIHVKYENVFKAYTEKIHSREKK